MCYAKATRDELRLRNLFVMMVRTTTMVSALNLNCQELMYTLTQKPELVKKLSSEYSTYEIGLKILFYALWCIVTGDNFIISSMKYQASYFRMPLDWNMLLWLLELAPIISAPVVYELVHSWGFNMFYMQNLNRFPICKPKPVHVNKTRWSYFLM